MADAHQQKVQSLFSIISGGISSGDHELVLRNADEILALVPNDLDAFKCKLIALIKLGKYEEASQMFDSDTQWDTLFEKAYVSYRLKKNDDVASLLEKIDSNFPKQVPLNHLKAQLDYRTENYERAIKLYTTELADSSSEDWYTNLMACYFSNGEFQSAIDVAKGFAAANDVSHDFLYNFSCALADNGDLKEAQEALEVAFKKGLDSFRKQDYSDEDIEIELQPISVMRAYVLHLLGDHDEAHARYSSILHTEKGDGPSIVTAANNSVALRSGEEKVFESLKRLARAAKVPEDSLSPRQRKALKYNQALLALYGKQNQRCQNICKELISKYPDDEFPRIILASLYVREKQSAKSVNELANVKSISGLLSKVLCLLFEKNYKHAASVLEEAPEDLRHQPGFVATIIALYDQIGDVTAAVATFNKCIEYHTLKGDSTKASLLKIKSAVYKFKKGLFEECVEDFEALGNSKRVGKIPLNVLCSIVIASSKVGSKIASHYAGDLPAVPGLDMLDADELERKIATPLEFLKKKDKTKEKDSSIQVKEKKKKKKKPRFPKNFDPANPGPKPDPERWLPKWQRSSMRKKLGKKNRDGAIFKGAQGSGDGSSEPVFTGSRKDSASSIKSGVAATSPISESKTSNIAAGKRNPKKKRK